MYGTSGLFVRAICLSLVLNYSLISLVTSRPRSPIAMDILGPLSITPRGNRYVLVISDYFTKWTESYAIPDQAATTVAEKVVSEYVCRCLSVSRMYPFANYMNTLIEILLKHVHLYIPM